jgi:predicted nucleotidyltransferase
MREELTRALEAFVGAARTAFGPDLTSVVLFGSGAEDRLRATSDVNVVVVLRSLDPAKARAFREPLALAAAAIRLRAMFLLETEVAEAARLFAVKFADVHRRHRVLWGTDPFAALMPPRTAAIERLKQVLLNLALRLRSRFLSEAREERLAYAVADAAGPLRACAAEILELEGTPAASPKEALEKVAGTALDTVSQARETGALPAGKAEPALLGLIDLANSMRARTERLA